MKKTTTPTVDAIGQITFQGNIIPPSWFKAIKRGDKAHLLAINILSDVVYWYRPTYSRDEETGELISITKKFRSDKLQKDYRAWALLFGQSKEQVKDACDLLIALNLITREFRDVRTDSRILPNVMFVEPLPENIAHITHKIGGISPLKPPPYSGENQPPIPSENGGTNTESTPKISTESTTENDDASSRAEKSVALAKAKRKLKPNPTPKNTQDLLFGEMLAAYESSFGRMAQTTIQKYGELVDEFREIGFDDDALRECLTYARDEMKASVDKKGGHYNWNFYESIFRNYAKREFAVVEES